MKLDKIDRAYLEYEGNAQDRLKVILNLDASKNNSAKYNTGIMHLINYKLDFDDNSRNIGEMEETIIKADGSVVTKRDLILSETESQDPTFVMKAMGYSPLQWKLNWVKTKRGYWDVSMKLRKIVGYDEDNKPIYEDNPDKKTNHTYKCEISISPIQKVLTEEAIQTIFEKQKSPDLHEYRHSKSIGELLELPIMDLHLGKLAWKKESGDDYDLKIAETLYREAIETILNRVNAYGLNIERIVFPVGQDFFHFDTAKSTTTKGTVMDTDTRWPKMYEKGVELNLWAIENLRAIAPVEVIYVAANHDKMLSFFLVHHINAWFRNCKDVVVNTSPYPRKYVTYGKCLIGYSHGTDEGKKIDILMQQECPTWSSTLWREWHLGHLHSEHAREIGGVIIRNISSVTSRDIWHTEHGYHAVRKAQAFVWNKEKGKILTIDVNVME